MSTVLIVRYIHPNSEIFVITTDIPSSSMSVTWEFCPGTQSPWWRGAGTRSAQIVQRWSYLKISQSKWRQKSPIDQLEWKKKSEIVAEVSYTTNWCSQDIRLKQSRILHSVLLIMESVIILRHFFRFWVQPHSIFNNLFAGPFWNVCDSDCLRPVRSNLQRWDFGEILKVQ